MIFAAGLGTRLRPLTNDRPKAMVELAGKPLLEHVILKMKAVGIDRIVVNVHHFADMIEDFLRRQENFGCDIRISDERDCLLDTGGGLLRARELFRPGEPVLIHNVDIWTDLDLTALVQAHEAVGNYATLVTAKAQPGRGFRFDAEGVLKGWENSVTGERKVVDDAFFKASSYSFCGIHVVSPAFLQHMEGEGVFSIVDEYLAQAARRKINMFYHKGYFRDLGTPETLAEVEKNLFL